jgi:hypothetical protein
VNAGLLAAYLAREDAPTAPAATATSPEPPEVIAAEHATCAACEDELQDCRTASWRAVAAAMERRAADVLADGDEAADDEEAPGALSATPELQQEALDQIAREHLRRHWESAEEELLGVVQRDLSDPGKQKQDLERDVGQLTGVLGLGDDRAGEFGDEYARLRAARIAKARAAVENDPPDWRGVAAAAKGLFADEDTLAERFGGAEGRARVRLSQLDKRTALLGVLATLAGDPWDDGITW